MARFTPPRAEESVTPNLIPMIDIMFLLLMFLMLGADMSQRELAEVQLPEATEAKSDRQASAEVVIVNVHHRDDVVCAVHRAGDACRDASHYATWLRDADYAGDALVERLRIEADRAPEVQPDGRRLSATQVCVRSDRSAPYGLVQDTLQHCAKAGLYRLSVAAAAPPER